MSLCVYVTVFTHWLGSQQEIPASEDVHTVASLLKLYLRELPDPIIPFHLFQMAVDSTKCKGIK